VSSLFSRLEKNISLQLSAVDAVGQMLLQRVSELLATRPEVTRADFGRRIGRGHSWISEFLAGIRTTNDVRLLVRIARVLGVRVGYLLGEQERPLDPGAATVLATWDALSPSDRELFLSVTATFRKRTADSSAPADGGSHAAPNEGHNRKRSKDTEPPKRVR
jgi:transcriptional regulator with XRE-family HTH domain